MFESSFLQSILEPRCFENPEQASGALSNSVESDDGKVKGCFLVVIVIVAVALSLGLVVYVFSRCAVGRQNKQQPQPQSADKEQDETVAEDDDTTEFENP